MLPSIVPGKENVSNFVFLWWITVCVTNMKLHEEQNMICWVTFFIKDSTELSLYLRGPRVRHVRKYTELSK